MATEQTLTHERAIVMDEQTAVSLMAAVLLAVQNDKDYSRMAAVDDAIVLYDEVRDRLARRARRHISLAQLGEHNNARL